MACGDGVPSKTAVFDIVFVHGITGDYLGTWTHEGGECWLNWLASDFPNANVYTVGYDSTLFSSLLKGGGATLGDRATMLMDRILSRKTPDRPILFIAHSLGGLIVKQMLRKSQDASNKRRRRLHEDAIGTVFIATPHMGSQFAKSVTTLLDFGLSKSSYELAHGVEPLIDLAQWFSNWANTRSLATEAYYEVDKYKGILVVDKVTANPNVFGCDPIALQADHVSITKLASRDSQLYQSVSAFIADLIQTSDNSGGSGGQFDEEFNSYVTQAETDRRSLAQKLGDAGRGHEIPRAERQKERFSMTLQRNIAQPAAVRRYTRLMSNIDTRHHRFVTAGIAIGKTDIEVNDLIQNEVIDPCCKAYDVENGDGTQSLVESAYYYLAGNCHLGWDNG